MRLENKGRKKILEVWKNETNCQTEENEVRKKLEREKL